MLADFPQSQLESHKKTLPVDRSFANTTARSVAFTLTSTFPDDKVVRAKNYGPENDKTTSTSIPTTLQGFGPLLGMFLWFRCEAVAHFSCSFRSGYSSL
jgi:hypothetical protein